MIHKTHLKMKKAYKKKIPSSVRRGAAGGVKTADSALFQCFMHFFKYTFVFSQHDSCWIKKHDVSLTWVTHEYSAGTEARRSPGSTWAHSSEAGGAFKGHRRFVKMLVSQDKIGIERLKFEASADHQWAHNEALMAFSHVSRHFICANVAHRKAH